MTTRTALLDAAEHAARTRGFDAFSYADLSRAVGIRKASIHHHFPAKADLAHALISRYRESFALSLKSICEMNETAGARLSAFLDSYRSALSGGEAVCLCVAFSTGRDSFQDPVLAELDGFHRDCLAWLENVFTQALQDKSVSGAGAADAEASACLALVEGAQLIARAARDPRRFDDATTVFRGRLVNRN
ncbi:MAG: TetR/AcrR family transcriptional regulator [Hyphomicrobiales bacterium]|nr:TetR/AcrR family transcriptional regulator [Hyphomicrobiales bacterium]MCP4999773.1 TetR/AcrR family transcriptional regulator [Hyphomicrobiales bacterium]